MQTANTHTHKIEETTCLCSLHSLCTAVEHIPASTRAFPATVSPASYLNICCVQPCLFWFICDGRTSHAAAHFLVRACSGMHEPCPETIFPSGPRHGARAQNRCVHTNQLTLGSRGLGSRSRVPSVKMSGEASQTKMSLKMSDMFNFQVYQVYDCNAAIFKALL